MDTGKKRPRADDGGGSGAPPSKKSAPGPQPGATPPSATANSRPPGMKKATISSAKSNPSPSKSPVKKTYPTTRMKDLIMDVAASEKVILALGKGARVMARIDQREWKPATVVEFWDDGLIEVKYDTGAVAKGPASLSLVRAELSNTLDAKDDDVLGFSPGWVKKELNEEGYITKTGLTTAEIEHKQGWTETHVLRPAAVSRAIENSGKRCAPVLTTEETAKNRVEEYMCRAFQELLCVLLPQVVIMARHTKEADGKANAQEDKLKAANTADNHVPVLLKTRDLLSVCSTSRVISKTISNALKDSIAQHESDRCFE